MGIRLKLSLPVAVVTLVLAAIGIYVIQGELRHLNEANLQALVQAKRNEVDQAIATSSGLAMETAALFSRAPAVVDAYETALSGDINDPESPTAQQAREMLRRELAGTLQGYEAATGRKFQLHFHLPNARSLLRAWRDKQAKRGNAWLDISDDISDFRQTVIDVNRDGKPLQGIELGRGGFAIRGLAPVQAPNGRRLGSVEVLLEFAPILARASQQADEDLALYMNADRLPITTNLQDTTKNPLVGEGFVQVAKPGQDATAAAATPAFLEQGRKGLSWKLEGEHLYAAFPVQDYKGVQIGVMLYAQDVATQLGIIHRTTMILSGLLLLLLVIPTALVLMVVTRYVVRPVKRMTGVVRDITEDRADLKVRLDDRQSDEIGGLATWCNRLLAKIEEYLCDIEGYQNLVNAVSDPIFAVDDDMRILVANQATEKLLGKKVDDIKGRMCAELLRTELCGTPGCPIQCMKDHGVMGHKIINVGSEAEPLYIQPIGDELKDCYGKRVGYVEVARVVTDLVLKEQETQENADRLDRINRQIMATTEEIAVTTERMANRFETIASGATVQNDRVHETATAMEQMNASVLEIARSATEAADQAGEAQDHAHKGQGIVQETIQAIADVREKAELLKANMGDLGQRAEGIGQVINVINDIADQTNLLALNAAIEAARAGDAGRGFAVVADEVRKLAEKTMAATKEVGEVIQAIQVGARANSEVVDEAGASVERASELVGRSGQALEGIVSLVNRTTERVQSIAAAAEEQSATSEEINRAVSEVSRIANETSTAMEEATATVMDLSRLSEDLRDISQS